MLHTKMAQPQSHNPTKVAKENSVICRQTGILVTEITVCIHRSSRSSEETMRCADRPGHQEVVEDEDESLY